MVPKNGKPVALNHQREAANIEHSGAIACNARNRNAVAKQIAREEYGAWWGVAVHKRLRRLHVEIRFEAIDVGQRGGRRVGDDDGVAD